MICRHCRDYIPEDSRFCPKCGVRLWIPPVPNVRVDAAARFQSSIAGRIKLRNTPQPLASDDLFSGVASSKVAVATHLDGASHGRAAFTTPMARAAFQLPSGSFFRTMSTFPRMRFTSPPGDST